jgi:hypothetical protein
MRTPSAVVALILILLGSFRASLFCPVIAQVTSSPDVYVGAYLAYGDVGEAKGLIDQVYSYTNLKFFEYPHGIYATVYSNNL